MWTYQQTTGQMAHDGELLATGYSGNAALAAAIAQDVTDQATATTQADADVNAAITLLQGMLSTAPAA